MTEQQMKERAEKYAEKVSFRIPFDGTNKFYDEKHFEWAKEAYLAGLRDNQEGKPEEKDENEALNAAMALCRTGWQMACDELLSYCNERKVSPEFIDHLFTMMDEKKKRQFSWETLRAEMAKMDATALAGNKIDTDDKH
jgi:hypothetical protein